MSKLTIAILTGTMLLAGVPLVFADETHADCEKNVTYTGADGQQHNDAQPWIGYTSTDPVRNLFYQATDGSGVGFNNCEGEQWDGQDQVSSNPSGSFNGAAECTPSSDGITNNNPTNVNLCMSNDLNEDTAANSFLATPLGVRVSTDGNRVYVGTNIRGVGDAVVYQSVNSDGTLAQSAIYLRDNSNDATGTNVLATIISAARITKGSVSEADCTQAQYAQSAADPDHPTCGRDNTAIALEVLP